MIENNLMFHFIIKKYYSHRSILTFPVFRILDMPILETVYNEHAQISFAKMIISLCVFYPFGLSTVKFS